MDNDDDGAVVMWEVGDVRPERTLDTDSLYVLVGEAPSTRQLSIRWRATSTSVSGVAKGAIQLRCRMGRFRSTASSMTSD